MSGFGGLFSSLAGAAIKEQQQARKIEKHVNLWQGLEKCHKKLLHLNY